MCSVGETEGNKVLALPGTRSRIYASHVDGVILC